MAVAPTVTRDGRYTRYSWVLTATDQTAEPTPPIGYRSAKTVDVRGASDANGFNGATVALQGSLDVAATGTYKTLNTVPDTTDLSFTAASTTLYEVLPNALRLKPVVTAGTVGATGVEVVVLVTMARGAD